MFTRRTSASDRTQSARSSQWPAHGDTRRAVCGGGVRAATTAGRERALRYGAVARRHDARLIERAAANRAEQSGYLCADRYTFDYRRDASSGIRHMIPSLSSRSASSGVRRGLGEVVR